MPPQLDITSRIQGLPDKFRDAYKRANRRKGIVGAFQEVNKVLQQEVEFKRRREEEERESGRRQKEIEDARKFQTSEREAGQDFELEKIEARQKRYAEPVQKFLSLYSEGLAEGNPAKLQQAITAASPIPASVLKEMAGVDTSDVRADLRDLRKEQKEAKRDEAAAAEKAGAEQEKAANAKVQEGIRRINELKGVGKVEEAGLAYIALIQAGHGAHPDVVALSGELGGGGGEGTADRILPQSAQEQAKKDLMPLTSPEAARQGLPESAFGSEGQLESKEDFRPLGQIDERLGGPTFPELQVRPGNLVPSTVGITERATAVAEAFQRKIEEEKLLWAKDGYKTSSIHNANDDDLRAKLYMEAEAEIDEALNKTEEPNVLKAVEPLLFDEMMAKPKEIRLDDVVASMFESARETEAISDTMDVETQVDIIANTLNQNRVYVKPQLDSLGLTVDEVLKHLGYDVVRQ